MRRFIGRLITGRPVTTAECGPIGAKGIDKPHVARGVKIMSPTKFPKSNSRRK